MWIISTSGIYIVKKREHAIAQYGNPVINEAATHVAPKMRSESKLHPQTLEVWQISCFLAGFQGR